MDLNLNGFDFALDWVGLVPLLGLDNLHLIGFDFALDWLFWTELVATFFLVYKIHAAT